MRSSSVVYGAMGQMGIVVRRDVRGDGQSQRVSPTSNFDRTMGKRGDTVLPIHPSRVPPTFGPPSGLGRVCVCVCAY